MRHLLNRTLLIAIAISCTTLHSLPCLAWGQEGHRIIAKIAYDHLNKKVRKHIDHVMGSQGMIYCANWADEIKSDTIYPQSYDWHFQDFDGGLSDAVVADALIHYPKEGGNLFRALDSLTAILSDPTRRARNEEHNLRFVIHLSGDRYCPMHTAHMDDLGGNRVKMKWHGQDTKLHAVWDEKLIDSQGYSYTEYAAMLEKTYAAEKQAILAMSDTELLLRNYHFTEAIYAYQQTWDGNTWHYIYRWHTPMERQLYIAGIRLAQLLNRIYK